MKTLLRCARAGMLCTTLLALGCGDAILVSGDRPAVMRRVAGQPNVYGAVLDSLAATNTQLALPRGVAVAADGTLYIADGDNARIVAVSPTGRARVIVDDEDCESVCLEEPWAITTAPDGSIWIADYTGHRVFQLDPASGALTVAAGTGEPGSDADGTPALEARIAFPAGVAVDDDGIVYFSERGGHRVRAIDADGTLRTVAGTGEPGYSQAFPATSALLNGPSGLAVTGTTLYIADELNERVRAVGLVSGQIRIIAGLGVAGYAETDTLALTAMLDGPRALALSDDGLQLFVAEAGNHVVRAVTLPTGRIARFAGTGETAFAGEGRDAGDTSLYEPSGVAAGRDFLFISDTRHHVVWRTSLRF